MPILIRTALLLGLILPVLGTSSLLAQSLCWRVEGNGLAQPSYLYGTIHVADPAVFRFTDGFLTAWDSAQAVAVELLLDEINPLEMLQLMMLPDGQRLRDALGEHYPKVQLAFDSLAGINIAMFDQMQPIMLWMTLTQQSMGGGGSEGVLDAFLAQRASITGRQAISLERVSEQIGAITSLSLTEQAELVLQLADTLLALGSLPDPTESLADLTRLYLRAELDSFALLMADTTELPEALRLALLDHRNHTMAHRADSLFRLRPTLIAVGAGHLGGAKGLIPLLRTRGYTVTAMPTTHTRYDRVRQANAWEVYELVTSGTKPGVLQTRVPMSPEPLTRWVGQAVGSTDNGLLLVAAHELDLRAEGLTMAVAVFEARGKAPKPDAMARRVLERITAAYGGDPALLPAKLPRLPRNIDKRLRAWELILPTGQEPAPRVQLWAEGSRIWVLLGIAPLDDSPEILTGFRLFFDASLIK
jgi:uncharacterized protein YbaP (TraB family)